MTATRARDAQPISPEVRCGDSDPVSLKQAISILPRASPGELWATNSFVATDGTVDAEAIKAVHGLDVDRFEAETGRSLDAAASETRGEPIVPVEDHQDIVDERRKALHALGYVSIPRLSRFSSFPFAQYYLRRATSDR